MTNRHGQTGNYSRDNGRESWKRRRNWRKGKRKKLITLLYKLFLRHKHGRREKMKKKTRYNQRIRVKVMELSHGRGRSRCRR